MGYFSHDFNMGNCNNYLLPLLSGTLTNLPCEAVGGDLTVIQAHQKERKKNDDNDTQ